MGNTPSAQASPARATGGNGQKAISPQLGQSDTVPNPNRPNLRLPLPQRTSQISTPNDSNPASPSGGARGNSPRRRKSLELPDLNKLSFTPAVPAAPVHTMATATGPTSQGKRVEPDGGSPSRRWKMGLGPRKSGLGAMTRIDASPRAVSGSKDDSYFPNDADRGRTRAVEPIAIPGRKEMSQSPGGTPPKPPPPTVAPSPPTHRPMDPLAPTEEGEADGSVSVPVRWEGSGKQVSVICDFADNWKKRIKLNKVDGVFETILRVPPGQYRLKFLVDDSWRCSKNIPTATDNDGTLVNWLEVEAPKTEDESRAEWAMDSKPPAPKHEDIDDSQWTSTIPAPLFLYQYLEELPSTMSAEQWSQHYRDVPHLTAVPQPPMLPRVLEKVIVNSDARKQLSDEVLPGSATPAGTDDNSILAIPNHVILNHLTASAIKHGTLGVGTTTRYRKKFITTMYFKPTLQDLMEGNPGVQNVPERSETTTEA
ncbi:5'-AMP-activated protein kinase beta subunit, interation domain-domain-containing protein [Kockovaella imperatae]|uniref:5'-AMP-activated protein kinase beta subunit, interation domain-domain-containing protein n=1 Tax=Kockovaella imperatae TaxID=4999 RepID=A0A1Y1U7K7_9TREE|nr:5'-AMP-activated protein kinase beta subunit, interation domain-domain-containing protein [Kockovaella imperatae]ORX33524.1 5'-AMP-activated protein kinase beta subunit, interation domain-domain-containing protein [Kockovaella imperatae]